MPATPGTAKAAICDIPAVRKYSPYPTRYDDAGTPALLPTLAGSGSRPARRLCGDGAGGRRATPVSPVPPAARLPRRRRCHGAAATMTGSVTGASGSSAAAATARPGSRRSTTGCGMAPIVGPRQRGGNCICGGPGDRSTASDPPPPPPPPPSVPGARRIGRRRFGGGSGLSGASVVARSSARLVVDLLASAVFARSGRSRLWSPARSALVARRICWPSLAPRARAPCSARRRLRRPSASPSLVGSSSALVAGVVLLDRRGLRLVRLVALVPLPASVVLLAVRRPSRGDHRSTSASRPDPLTAPPCRLTVRHRIVAGAGSGLGKSDRAAETTTRTGRRPRSRRRGDAHTRTHFVTTPHGIARRHCSLRSDDCCTNALCGLLRNQTDLAIGTHPRSKCLGR